MNSDWLKYLKDRLKAMGYGVESRKHRIKIKHEFIDWDMTKEQAELHAMAYEHGATVFKHIPNWGCERRVKKDEHIDTMLESILFGELT